MVASPVAAAIARTRPIFERLMCVDASRLQRPTEVEDGRGGRTTTWVTIESGMGLLQRGGLRGETNAVAERLGWSSHYDIDLPIDTIATAKDRIVIAGRTFVVGEIVKADVIELKATAVSQEHG